MEWIFKPSILFIIALLGMFTHYLKKKVKGESLTEIKDYFRDHLKSTFIALVSTSITYVAYMFTLATGQPADVITIFGLGYMCDSFFNKYETND